MNDRSRSVTRVLRSKRTARQPYDASFYENRYEETRFAAEAVLAIIRRAIPEVKAAVDVGCGVGAWLRVLKDNGVPQLLGVDGAWVRPESLVIPRGSFVECDLSSEDIPARGKYDLVISLEVAEHLPAGRARQFVSELARLGDFILFSAAIPGQGGEDHFNEQWPEYWVQLFQEHGYRVFDVVRSKVWSDPRIAVHYRQNILLFVRCERVRGIRAQDATGSTGPLSVVHPELFLHKMRSWREPTITRSLELLGRAVVKRLRRQLGLSHLPRGVL